MYRSYDKKEKESWTAPEHGRFAMAMKRDYIRDDLGRPLPSRKRELVIDRKPLVMKEHHNEQNNSHTDRKVSPQSSNVKRG